MRLERNRTKAKRRTEKAQKKNKMFVLRKRQVLAMSLMLLIGVAGYLNYSLTEETEDPGISVMYQEATKKLGEAKMVAKSEESAAVPTNSTVGSGVKNNKTSADSDYFVSARTERDKSRSSSMESYKEIINGNGDSAAKEQATKALDELTRFTEAEAAAEQRIRAKGYGECVVFMNAGGTSVAIKTNGLNEIDAAVILDLVAQSGAVSPESIKIVEIKPNS